MPLPGNVYDGYRLIRPIGRGGFGEVWLCQLEATGEYKALKFLSSSDPSQLESELAALIRYRAVLRDLNSPNLVSVEHVNRTGDGLFYIMPLADGLQEGLEVLDAVWQPLTLAAQIAGRKTAATWFCADEIRAMILPLIEAVGLLNAAGLVHRDIKPENVLFIRNRPCLGDVGLLTNDTAQITRRGTPGYAAPSWYLESGANPDMWGLATTLYTLISGNAPDKIGRGAFLYPPQGERTVEMAAWEQFHHAIFRATSGEPAERFLQIQDFAKAIGTPPSSTPRVGSAKGSKWLEAFRLLALLLACGFLVVALRTAWLWHFHTPSPGAPESPRTVKPRITPSDPNVPANTPEPTPVTPSSSRPSGVPSESVAAAIGEFDRLYQQTEARFMRTPSPELDRKVQDLKARLKGKVHAPATEIRLLLDELEALAPEIKKSQISAHACSTSTYWVDLSNAAHRIPRMASDERERFECRQTEMKLQAKAENLKTKLTLENNSFQGEFEGFVAWFYLQQMQAINDLAKESHGRRAADIDRRSQEAMEINRRFNAILKKCQPSDTASPLLGD